MSATALVGGTVVDGSGRPGERADVLVDDGVIVAVGALGELGDGVRRLDAAGLCVAPGFVDAHSHGDDAPLVADAEEHKVPQGVTTEVVGNCGLGLAPRPTPEAAGAMARFFPDVEWPGDSVAELWAETDRRGYVTNYVPLVGHGALRASVAGLRPGPLDAAELDRVSERLEAAMDAGAAGLSTGLTYPPGWFADTAELARLATVAARAGGVYATHLRSEGAGRLRAIDEAVEIGRRSGARVQLSHHKALGRSQWGTIEQSLARVEQARRSGVDVGFDVYPYRASATTLVACLPPELSALPDEELLTVLRGRDGVRTLRARLAESDWENRIDGVDGAESVVIGTTPTGEHAGRSLAELAGEWGTDAAGALARLLVHHRLRIGMTWFGMSAADVDLAVLDENTCIGSDSAGAAAGRAGSPHPRGAGTFARVLGHYVRERRLLRLEEAVRRMTSLPAARFGLDRVGSVRRGFAADLVVFDPEVVADRATYLHPRRPAVGIRHVLVSGHAALLNGRPTGLRAGRRLIRPGPGPGSPPGSGSPRTARPRPTHVVARPAEVGQQQDLHPRKDPA